MKMTARHLLVAASGLACLSAADARSMQEYDTFSDTLLDGSRWVELDQQTLRTVEAGRALLGRRSFGNAGSDAGTVFEVTSLSFTQPERLTTIAADVVIETADTTACATNPVPASAKLRLGGAFFNNGTPVDGNATGDVVAQVTWTRASDSTDGAGVLRLAGTVLRCLNADCSNATALGGSSDMGTVNTGAKHRITLRWDAGAKAFSFRRDNGLPLIVNYTDSDTAAPGRAGKAFSVRNLAPNCASGPRGTVLMKTRIDNVSVNADAL
jgi:hypothetical protein